MSALIRGSKTRKDKNYCNVCRKKLHNKEKAKSTDADFKWPICNDCAYILAYKYVSEYGFPKVFYRYRRVEK